MTYVARIRNLLRGLSLDAALLATLALPALVLAGNFAEPAQPGVHPESASRHVGIPEATSLIFTVGWVNDDRIGQTGD